MRSSTRSFEIKKRAVLFLICELVFLGVGVFTLPSDIAHAAHLHREAETAGTETKDPIKDATVNLYCRLKAGRKTYSTSGSGVFVSDTGVILTNAHVAQYFLLAGKEVREQSTVTGRCSVRTGSPAKDRYSASVLYFPVVWVEENADELTERNPKGTGKNDFAFLYITGAKRGALPKAFPILATDTTGAATEQEAVTIVGYPTEKLNFDEIHRELTVLTASSTVTGMHGFRRNQSTDVLTLAPSAAGSAGVSGGPVVDNEGEVIGIVTIKSTAKDDRTLRAITLSYIDRAVRSQTALPLTALLSGNFAIYASSTNATITSKTVKLIANGLLKKR